MKYKVKLSYYSFTFATRDEALDFAELAVSASDEELSVGVTICKPEPELGLPEQGSEEVSDNE